MFNNILEEDTRESCRTSLLPIILVLLFIHTFHNIVIDAGYIQGTVAEFIWYGQ